MFFASVVVQPTYPQVNSGKCERRSLVSGHRLKKHEAAFNTKQH